MKTSGQMETHCRYFSSGLNAVMRAELVIKSEKERVKCWPV